MTDPTGGGRPGERKRPSERKRATADSFGDASAAYLESAAHRRGADLDLLAAWCDGANRVLDVATGAGHTAGAVAAVGGRDAHAAADAPVVVAADAAPAMVETAETSFDGLAGVVADAERLPFDSDAFDAVTCRIAAHHFPDPEAFVAEVARVLRPGGTLAFEDNVASPEEALAEFINRVERTRDPTHVESHSTATWHAWLADAGFAVEETHHLKKTLEFDPWVEAQSLSEAGRERLTGLFADAPPGAAECFEIEWADGNVRSFANLKALVRAELRD